MQRNASGKALDCRKKEGSKRMTLAQAGAYLANDA
jgi:hypothetical protein